MSRPYSITPPPRFVMLKAAYIRCLDVKRFGTTVIGPFSSESAAASWLSLRNLAQGHEFSITTCPADWERRAARRP